MPTTVSPETVAVLAALRDDAEIIEAVTTAFYPGWELLPAGERDRKFDLGTGRWTQLVDEIRNKWVSDDQPLTADLPGRA